MSRFKLMNCTIINKSYWKMRTSCLFRPFTKYSEGFPDSMEFCDEFSHGGRRPRCTPAFRCRSSWPAEDKRKSM